MTRKLTLYIIYIHITYIYICIYIYIYVFFQESGRAKTSNTSCISFRYLAYILRLEFKADFSEIAAASNEQVLDDFFFSKTSHLALCTPRDIDVLLSIPSGVHDPSSTPSLPPTPAPTIQSHENNLETNHVHHVIQRFPFPVPVVSRARFLGWADGHVFKHSDLGALLCINDCTCFKQIPLSNFKIFRSYDINSQSSHDIMYK